MGSVEAHGVQECAAALLLELLQQLIDLILHVLRVLDLRRAHPEHQSQAQPPPGLRGPAEPPVAASWGWTWSKGTWLGLLSTLRVSKMGHSKGQAFPWSCPAGRWLSMEVSSASPPPGCNHRRYHMP